MTILRSILLAVISGCIALTASARTVLDFFAEAPEEIIPLLTTNTRLDMIDYYASGLSTPSSNTLSGKSRIVEADSLQAEIQLSEEVTFQLALYPTKNDTLIVVVETFATPIPDSKIKVLNKDWSLREERITFDRKDFISKNNLKASRKADMPEMIFVHAVAEPSQSQIRLINTTPQYYISEDSPSGLELMDPVAILRFNGSTFRR